MKKAKIMLIGIAVLAIVGGTLAVRTNKLSNHVFCYTTDPNSGNPICNVPLTQATVAFKLGAFVAYYLPVNDEAECNEDEPCAFIALITTSNE